MMRMEPVNLEGRTALAIEVKSPKTTLLAVATDKGYIMCGAIRGGKVIAGRLEADDI
ncbi:hypothetical protein LJK88_38845 [Paenibacillus sp. P26]|nr:hypothetical protein LJK88_38845 [Paenibacillus sp. P26]UUZ93133.1 hypothetical protein LJK87_49460 [Paenibacillus sp. P25]